MNEILPPPPTLAALVERARGLYTLPAVAMKVLELTTSPQVDARALKNCIENDPALVAKLLRVVNSSLFGLSRQVSDLNQALALLGVKPLKLLVLGFSLPKALFEGLEAETLAAYWRRTLTKATAAREFCEAAWRRSADEAFIAGLLQDIGQLALVQNWGEPYVAFLERARREGGELAGREMAVLGFDHAVFSARLLEHWGLPEGLVRAVAQRQEIETLAALTHDSRLLPQSLHLAELAARLLVDAQADALLELHEAASRYADLTPQQVDALLHSLRDTVGPLAEALCVELSEGVDCQRLLREAHARRTALADAAVHDVEQTAEETRLWQEAEALRHATEAFLADGAARADAPPSSFPLLPTRPAADDRLHVAPSTTAVSSDWELLSRIEAAVIRCRERRVPVSLLAIALDKEDKLASIVGAEGVRRAMQVVVAAANSLCGSSGTCVAVGNAHAAAVLEGCDRPQTVELARRLIETVARCAAARRDWFGGAATISVGAATLALPPRNFPSHELIDAAWRCLYAARTAGGNVVKSIDIY